MNKFRDLQAAFLAKSFVTTAILFSLFAFSGHFATAEAQSGSWRLKDIQVFTKMGGYSQITSEKYDKTGDQTVLYSCRITFRRLKNNKNFIQRYKCFTLNHV